MATRRCSTCSINYPNTPAWRKCLCGDATDAIRDDPPDLDWKHRAAEAFYRKWDAERVGPSPEEIGAEEARALVELAQIEASGKETA